MRFLIIDVSHVKRSAFIFSTTGKNTGRVWDVLAGGKAIYRLGTTTMAVNIVNWNNSFSSGQNKQ